LEKKEAFEFHQKKIGSKSGLVSHLWYAEKSESTNLKRKRKLGEEYLQEVVNKHGRSVEDTRAKIDNNNIGSTDVFKAEVV